jgi:hypothetical protein
MDNRTKRGTVFEIVPWATPAQPGEFGDLLGRIGSGISDAAGRVADAVRGAGIIDLTAQGDKSLRRGTRDLKKVHALVLHQMACCFRRKDPLKDYLRLKAHFAILPDGRILQIHPVRELIWASNGFNIGSVAVEFAGNFSNTNGKWWQGDKFGRNQVTPAQIEAGRRLVRHLMKTMGLRTILAHRQSSATRENDPGPDIWYGVGQWAIDTLGLKDGGPGFKVGDGKPIPDLWRTWGRAKPAGLAKEAEVDEAEEEVVFGPLTATLKWLSRPYTHAEVIAKGGSVGGVYIAFRKPVSGNISILKVGMTDTFARRMKDPEYVAWSRQYPDLRFYLAEVRGNRGNRGVAGVVRMVEFALARLLRRAGQLKGTKLPFVPAATRGAIKIINVLPKALEVQLQSALFTPAAGAGGQPLSPGTQVTPGQLVLPAGFKWEAEQPLRSDPWRGL